MKLLIGLVIVLMGVAESSRRVHKCRIPDTKSHIPSSSNIQKRSEKLLLIGMVVGMTDSPRNNGEEEYETEHSIRRGEAPQTANLTVVGRTEWGARLPEDVITLATPVRFVVIHHSYLIKACKSRRDCTEAMRDIQDYHMDYRGWWDIGYNFAVGGDGAAYEGRGWSKMGAHALHWNNISIGICLIGDWSVCTPPEHQLYATKALIALGVEQGYISPDYQLIGHHQTRASTKCPGDGLYREIQKWNHWTDTPRKIDDSSTHTSSTYRAEGEY